MNGIICCRRSVYYVNWYVEGFIGIVKLGCKSRRLHFYTLRLGAHERFFFDVRRDGRQFWGRAYTPHTSVSLIYFNVLS